jgi:hypothetical protein
MKQTYNLIIAFFFLILACEKKDVILVRNNYIIAGDSVDNKYINFNPDPVFNSESDSFDVNFDNKFDVSFKLNSVFIDDCEEFFANCPPEYICDCWPTIYTDYLIGLASNTEIAIDKDSSVYEFAIKDTISNKNIWSNRVKYPLYHRTIDSYWTGSYEIILGIREIQTTDTLYSWIHIRLENSGVLITKIGSQYN